MEELPLKKLKSEFREREKAWLLDLYLLSLLAKYAISHVTVRSELVW